jgi:hypothetical protein
LPAGYANSNLVQSVDVTLRTDINTGDLDTLNFVNDRLFKVITFVCREGTTNSLYSGTATLGTSQSTMTTVPQALAAKGVTAADLCGLPGFTGLKADTATSSHTLAVHFV